MSMKSATEKNSRSCASNVEDSLQTKDGVTSDQFVGEVNGSAKKTGTTKNKLLKDKNSTHDTEIEKSAKVSKKNSKKGNPYTVFVGNISYKATVEEIKKHFEKAGEVVDIRIPTQKGTEKRKGFAYIEVKDRIAYEKALALHHTHIHGRQINVEYTTQGKKGGPKEEKIKQKNLKLRALSKVGILFPRIGLKKKLNVKASSSWGLDDEEKKTDKMAISNTKRARNTSEGDEKTAKKKKHSDLISKSVSSPKLLANKKGAPVNIAQSKQQKAVKNAAQGSSKKVKNLAAVKGADKTQASKTGKKSKKSTKEDDSDEDDDEEESDNEEVDEDDDDDAAADAGEKMQAEESDEVAGEEESDEEEENAVAEQEADDDSESDDNEAEGAEENQEEGDSDEDDDNEAEEDEDDSDADESPPKKTPKKQDSRDNDKSDDYTAFVSNIPYSAGQDDLKKFFGAAGTVTSVRIPIDNKSGRPRGFVFVSFEDEEGLNAALEMDGEEMDGRALKIMKSHNSGGSGERREGGFRGGRGFRGGDRRGGGFRGGDRGGRGGGFRGDRRGGGFRGGDRGGRGGFRGGDRRGGGRGFGGGDKFGGGGGRPFRGGGGKPWQKDGGDRRQKQSGGDSD